MEKLTVERFRKIKSYIIEMIELRNKRYAIFERNGTKNRERLKELEDAINSFRDELKNYDLSEIGFEEYIGFIDLGFDFEGTGANLDLNIINFNRRSLTPIRVKGCNIKNVNLDSTCGYLYDDKSFDEEFVQANPRYFLKKEVTDKEVRERFYYRGLTLQDIENWDLYDDCYIERLTTNWFGNYDSELDLRKIAEIIGLKNLVYLGANFVNIFIDDNIYSELQESNLSKTSSKEDVENIVFDAIKDSIFYDTNKLISLDNIESRKKLIECLKKVHYSDELKHMIKYGEIHLDSFIDNPEEYEEYMENMADLVGRMSIYGSSKCSLYNELSNIYDTLSILNFAKKYGEFLNKVEPTVFDTEKSQEDIEEAIQRSIEENILNRRSPYDETVPDFFKEKYPELFLDEKAPQKLKDFFYDRNKISFQLIKEHPEWREFLQGKNLSRAFPSEYSELFKRFDSSTLMKLGTRNPETIEKMVQNHREDVLESWYKSTGGKFVPHHVVMLNFPEKEIDSFLGNSKRWSQLMRIDNYNLNDDGKAAILKIAYTMGVFQGDDDGFNKTMKLFTDIPAELSEEEWKKIIDDINEPYYEFNDYDDGGMLPEDIKKLSILRESYNRNDDGKYILSIDKQKNKESVKILRKVLEEAQIPGILTSQKAHQMFDSFAMEYNPDFVKFFNENFEEIVSNPEYIKDIATIQRQFKDIATIQRQFKDIVRTNAGRRLTLDVAQDYIKTIPYTDIEVGNDGVAEQAKIVGYSQKDFEVIQKLFNEGETREFSSIPRIQGKTNGYTYEMLRCDDPLALTIGTLTDCCQEIHGAGQTSMEHSVVSPDGRVFCVRDAEGRLVAQSWFWRNQYTGCFDNIEIPDRIFTLYEKEHSDVGRKGLTTEVLQVYKQAAQDLMQEDARVYQELLESGIIKQEQYNSLLLGKVTIGLGYNDIADAIQEDKTIHKETDRVSVKGTERLPHPYTDASTQYTIAERDGIIKSEYENLYVHQDDVPVYDGTNMSSTVLLTMKRMEQATGRENLAYLSERSNEADLPRSQRIINSIAREYGLDTDSTKVMATARIALIYSKDKDKIRIGDLLSSPLKEGLTKEQKQKATAHIMHQVKKALKQIGAQDFELDLSSLSEEQQQMLQSVMQEIEKENDERGEI